MDKILRKPNIWDLHIHTPIGTPTKKNYNGISSEEFVESLINLYEQASNEIGMISFTDHNKINSEVYKLFKAKSDIAVIPGVEMDVYLNHEGNDFKHIIIYFDEEELDNIEDLSMLIDAYVNEHQKVYFEDFVLHLLNNNKKFVLSPHAFKQKQRGINLEWVDEESANKGIKRFSGLFFPFWEAGGKSDIWKAIEFLEDQCGTDENQQAVIAFSDSAEFEKIKSYIENPHQYFLCLNSFKGLLLAGTDLSRVIYNAELRPESTSSEKIKRVIISKDLKPINDNNRIEIEFSDRLNVIVGGRGKGKSALMSAIVATFDEKKIDAKKVSFAKKFFAKVESFYEQSMPLDTSIQYFSQSFINQLFDDDNQNKLEKIFGKEFSDNVVSNGIANIKTILEKGKQYKKYKDINVVDDLKYMLRLVSKTPEMNIKKKSINYISLQINDESYENMIKEILPAEIEIWDDNLKERFREFICVLLENISRLNYQQLQKLKFAELVRDKIEEYKKKRSEADRKKIDGRKHIEQKLKYLYTKELERIRQINNLYEISVNMTEIKVEYQVYDGEGTNQIFFVSVANKEHPVEYARRMIVEAINKSRFRNPEKYHNEELLKKYALDKGFDAYIKDTISVNDLTNRITTLQDLKHCINHRIIYKNADGYVDLHRSSPGVQTSVIMEYVLHSNSTDTLLIDQPEDNIDNEARYAQLTKWIRKQKNNRQIILVTHDANVVINGDAECVIVAEHSGEIFNYEYGALEYGNILDKAAVILDGGKVAIHKRMDKYGQ